MLDFGTSSMAGGVAAEPNPAAGWSWDVPDPIAWSASNAARWDQAVQAVETHRAARAHASRSATGEVAPGSDGFVEYLLDGVWVWGPSGVIVGGPFEPPIPPGGLPPGGAGGVPVPAEPPPRNPPSQDWITGGPVELTTRCGFHLPAGDLPHEALDVSTCPSPRRLRAGECQSVAASELTRAVGQPRAELVVLLHGRCGTPEAARSIANDFARVGFHVISLHWDAGWTARERCTAIHAVDPGWDAWNDCLEEQRTHKTLDPPCGVVPQLRGALELLNQRHPFGGWNRFLRGPRFLDGPRRQDEDAIDWESVILAGNSEGANEVAWLVRRYGVAGAVFLSGGGDGGTYELAQPGDPPTPLARYMTPQPPNPRFGGLRHDREANSYTAGWTANGVPQGQARVTFGELEASLTAPLPYTLFGPHRRVVLTDYLEDDATRARQQEAGNPGIWSEIAHGYARSNSPEISLARQYLACRAGGMG